MSQKILIVINSLRGGGAERVVSNLSLSLIGQGNAVTVVTLNDQSDDFYTLAAGVKRISISASCKKNKGALSKILALRAVVKQEQPSSVLSMMTVPSILTLLACVGIKCKVVISERNHPPKKPTPLHWRLLRAALYRFCDSAVVLTEDTAKWMRAAGCRDVHVVPVTVSLPLPELMPIVKVEGFIESTDFVLLSVGRLDYQKGFDLLLIAFSKITKELPAAKLVILGEGSERGKLEAMVRTLGIDSSVILPGRAGNISDWYARAQIFVFSSRFEGFGNVLVEAMASGCTCVSFDCDVGPRDVIEQGVDGFLVEAENVSAMASQLSLLYHDSLLRKKLGDNARLKGARFSEGRIMSRWFKVFNA